MSGETVRRLYFQNPKANRTDGDFPPPDSNSYPARRVRARPTT